MSRGDPDTRQFGKTPLHDEHSPAASAFQQMALSLKEPANKHTAKPIPRPAFVSATAWMG